MRLLLVPALFGVALAAESAPLNSRLQFTEAKVAELLADPKCKALITEHERCAHAMFVDDAVEYAHGNKLTAAYHAAGAERPEFGALEGISLPPSVPGWEDCKKRLEELSESDQAALRCVTAPGWMDMTRWARHEDSRFGAVLADEIERFKKYRSAAGFQSTRWGMTLEEVLKLYPKAARQRGESLQVKMSVAEYPVTVVFKFISGRLWAAEVGFQVDSTSPDRDVPRTLELRRLFSSKYGDAEITDGAPGGVGSPLDSVYNQFGGAGRALRAGRQVMQAKWSPSEMEIELTLGAVGGEYSHRLVYTSDVFVERASKQRDAGRASEL
jgi:hypothetical protein